MAGTKASVKKEAMQYLSEHDHVDGRNPVSKLAHKINRFDDVPIVDEAVRELANEGKAFVNRDSQGCITAIRYVHPRGTIDRTDRSFWDKKERMFAKGIPSTLPDDWCGEVTVSRRDDSQSQLPADEEVLATTNEEGDVNKTQSTPDEAPYDEVLSGALKVLRDMADENGYGNGLSVAKLLVEFAGMTNSQAARARQYLSGMGVAAYTQTGWQTWSYQLDMTVERVTPEMVAEYRARNTTGVVEQLPTSKEVKETEPVEEMPMVEAGTGTEEVLELTSLEQLVAIIEALETQLAQLKQQADRVPELEVWNANLQQRLNDADGEVELRTLEAAELKRENDVLRSQLQQAAHIDERITAVLSRHADVLPKRQQPGTAR